MAIYQLGDDVPEIHPQAFVAETATVIGKVHLGERASVWFGTVIRGDTDHIRIGRGSNIQDNSVLHTDAGIELVIGEDVTVGHQCVLHGCTIGDGSLIGIGAIVLNNAKIGRYCLVGAGSLVTEGKEFPDYSMIVGSPAKLLKTLTPEQAERMARGSTIYAERGATYASDLKKVG
ncbi:MAG TPA: gamma carbonic anhydrase family protein [Burkholderiaceae bacterium]|nr:gamma carbonic anhydrase family protein [Burkholderiaceae bacterium]HMX10296.1 gamma carbonic anhydrase family protein [Burkholderiaceae bacterium]HMY99827.1 gamma carbonic anhydrase family protein [Burkholderiaceae bacterium]HNG80012.1 gamma carbonic anhydrase family protein [Burkholderiaceae bacterium]